ncbi:uncharacterized protein LOC121848041 [Callorhinchus milii]|uniref:uncharacterized protein LOC121848041 n=1 Tax=Callorhinchus milii TaxID=7868 RepID=UPI001C3F6292|nr:uncharacterized protein LOC121848041 [Callorhinchus milii]
MEATDVSDCESDESVVAASVQESDGESTPDLNRMLFFHKNAIQLYHTMSDFTSGSDEPIGGIYSPVIQMIPKSTYFRLNDENHQQQQVNSQAYNGIAQFDQSQSLLRFGMNYLSGVSSTQNSIPLVQNVVIENNYSLENEETTTIDMVDAMQLGTNEQEIAVEEDSPEINLLTGAIITATPSAKKRRVLQPIDLSGADSATASWSEVYEDAPLQEEVAVSSVVKSLISTVVLSEPETGQASEQPVIESLNPLNEILSEQNNVESIAKQLVAGNVLSPVNLFRPLSSESLTKSPMNMAPLIKCQFAQKDGSILIETMEEKRQEVPVELLAPMNRMPLFNSDMKPSAATNNKLVVHSSNERTLGFKNDGFMLHEGDTQADDDLTQVTDYDLHSQSLIENENLGPTSVQLSADKNEAAADPSECEPVENIEKGQDIKKTSNSSHQDDAVKICIPRKSTRRRVNLDRLCFNLHVSQCHNSQPFQYSAERKRKAPSSDCEDLSEKLLNHRKTKRVQNSQHSARDCKNSNVPSLACIEFSQNVQTKKCANVQTKEAQFIKNTKTFMIQPQQGNRKTRAELRKAQNHKKRNRTTFSTGKADEERKKLTGDEAGSKQRSSQFRKIHTRSSSQHSKAKKETSLSCDTQSKARNNRNAENIVGSESSLSSLTASASSSFPFSLAHANRRNLYGETKLHIAVKNRDLNMLRAFIQAGVNVNLPDHAGWTPLHEASLQGFHEIVQELLSAGAEVNCKGDCGVTPLQDAAISGHYQHGAIAIQNADIGKCAQYVIDGKIKRLIDNQQQKRLEKGITKIGNKQLLRGVDFKNGVDCQKLEQEANCTTALHTDKGDIVITQSETGNDIVPTEDTDETMVFEPVISGHNLKETVTMEHQSNSSMPTCTMISSNKLNATPINLHSESKITVDNSSDTIGELNVNNSHVLSHSSVSTDQEAAEATNSSKAKEGHGSSKNSRSSNFVHSKWREFNHDTSEKDGPSHVAERNQSKEKTLNSTLHESEKIYKVQPAEVTGNMEMASKPSTSQVTSETSGSLTSCKKTTSSVDISTIRSINKKDGKGQSRLHLAVMKRDLLLAGQPFTKLVTEALLKAYKNY